MPDDSRQFSVGDVVIVRDWDDMEEEFGLDYEEDIDCEFTFTKGMAYLCGTQHVISEISELSGSVSFEDDSADRWSISLDMLRHADDDILVDVAEIDEGQFLSVLSD